jgi:hypothetical protein
MEKKIRQIEYYDKYYETIHRKGRKKRTADGNLERNQQQGEERTFKLPLL